MLKKIKNLLVKFFTKFLALDRFYFERIVLTKDFLQQAISYAAESHPYECFGLLHGTVKDKRLYLISVVFVPHSSEKTNVVTKPLIFNSVTEWGTIHSHPSGNIRPSKEDLITFSKNPVNIIIGHPYSSSKISIYNQDGKLLGFEIEY